MDKYAQTICLIIRKINFGYGGNADVIKKATKGKLIIVTGLCK